MKRVNNEAYKIAQHINKWITEYTSSIKSNSPHTIRTYIMTLSLFVKFLETEKGIDSSNLSFSCLSRTYVEEWILWLKGKRGCSPETCNIRLAALRAFLKYLAEKEIACLSIYQGTTFIPRQKVFKKKVIGMSKNAIKSLMLVPDVSTRTGRRDLVLMIVLYCTAARIDEILSLKINQLHVDVDKPHITVIGKGRKIRTLYLLPKAVSHLKKYLKEYHPVEPNSNAYVFYSRNKGIFEKISSEGVNKQFKGVKTTCTKGQKGKTHLTV